MKTNDIFQDTILTEMQNRAADDSLFAVKFANPSKNIEECCTYIFNTVQKSGRQGFCDEEVFSMAVHYYEEENIEVGNLFDCHVVVNHTIELTSEEKEEARQRAISSLQQEYIHSMRKNPAKNNFQKREEKPTVEQGSLF